MFGMTPHQFQLLHNILVHRYGLQGGNVITTEEAVGIFMWTVRGSESNRQTQKKFPHSGSTISLYFRRVLNRVYNLGVDNIRPRDPAFQGVHPCMTCPQFSPWFDGCIGAMDGTHILIQVTPSKNLPYIGREGLPTLNFVAVCDHDARFIFTCAKEGTLHDATVFQEAIEEYGDQFSHPPEGIRQETKMFMF